MPLVHLHFLICQVASTSMCRAINLINLPEKAGIPLLAVPGMVRVCIFCHLALYTAHTPGDRIVDNECTETALQLIIARLPFTLDFPLLLTGCLATANGSRTSDSSLPADDGGRFTWQPLAEGWIN